jgi:hypothetical protein
VGEAGTRREAGGVRREASAVSSEQFLKRFNKKGDFYYEIALSI